MLVAVLDNWLEPMLSTISFSVTSPALLEMYFVPPEEQPAKPITEILRATGKIAFFNFVIKISSIS